MADLRNLPKSKSPDAGAGVKCPVANLIKGIGELKRSELTATLESIVPDNRDVRQVNLLKPRASVERIGGDNAKILRQLDRLEAAATEEQTIRNNGNIFRQSNVRKRHTASERIFTKLNVVSKELKRLQVFAVGEGIVLDSSNVIPNYQRRNHAVITILTADHDKFDIALVDSKHGNFILALARIGVRGLDKSFLRKAILLRAIAPVQPYTMRFGLIELQSEVKMVATWNIDCNNSLFIFHFEFLLSMI